ncbi:Holliday junction resolvase RuvX [Solicola gregarius]|uniref:Putative pre-16S rRNA nuclease n=1 Tax=Solicola gregarius TaxID=2908642 RepID=A0AA46TGH2_9ACTN|nr:Holliday junction resolvase RuvX [Solicola gregarius]UYM04825.1 Holliday junction resolvase RuvX [Solicola gregarius]
MRGGARLGVDVGDARIGVAVSDPSGLLATPVETVAAGEQAIPRLAVLASEYDAVEVVVGLPRSLSGGLGPAARKVRAYAAQLAEAVAPTPVRLVDERMSTVTAEHALRTQGKRGKSKRAVIDQAAAVVILQSALDTERTSGSAPGETLETA